MRIEFEWVSDGVGGVWDWYGRSDGCCEEVSVGGGDGGGVVDVGCVFGV